MTKVLTLGLIFSLLLSSPFGFLPQHSGEPQEAGEIVLHYLFENPRVESGFQDPYELVMIPGLGNYAPPGKPVMPTKTARILVPFGKEVHDIRVIPGEKVYLGKFYIQPGQEAIPLNNGEEMEPTPPDEVIYRSTKPYPERPFSKVDTQWKMGYQILILNLFPVEYIPKSMEVSCFRSFEIVVKTKEAEVKKQALFRDEGIIRDMVDNPGEVASYPKVELEKSSAILHGQYDYVIITNDELKNAPEPNFQTLAEWKNLRGVTTTVVTVEDIYDNYTGVDNQEKIRNFIRDAYLNNGITYVLLGGDADGADVGGESGNNIVPVRGLWAWRDETDPPNIPSDLYYACLDGSYDSNGNGIYGEPDDGIGGGEVDLMAEVYVGRAPVDSAAELSNFVNKTISYENTSTSDPYLKEVWMVGELLWEEGGCSVEEAVERGNVTDPEGVLDSLRKLRDEMLAEEYVQLYYEYSPDVTRILIREPNLLIEAARLVWKYMPAVRYLTAEEGGKDLSIAESDVDEVTLFLERLKAEINKRAKKIGAPRVARIFELLDEFENEVNTSEGKNFSEAFRSSIYSGWGGSATLAGDTWGGDYKDEIKDGSSNHGYRTEGFPDTYNKSTLYDRDYPENHWPKSEIIGTINSNIHIINHLGHSGVEHVMKMYNEDVDSLTNDKYFFGYSQGCYAGSFDNRDAPFPYGSGDYLSYDCIAEHLVTSPTGAFAFIANSRFGWGQKGSTDGASQYYDRQFWDAIFSERIANIGRANQDSKEDNIGYISHDVMRFCYYEINLLGDPETPIFDLRPQYEHDIAVTDMNIPQKAEPGVSILVQATVRNIGTSDESNIEVQLLEDNTVKDTTTVQSLPRGVSLNVYFVWASDTEGEHKLRVYAVPVSGEEYTGNNYEESIIRVGRVILVDDDGAQCPSAVFADIQAAIDAASDGDIIRVYAGTYGKVIANTAIILTGMSMPTIDGKNKGNVIEIQANGVELQGFRIVNSGSDNNAGIVVQSSHNVVRNNIVTSNQCGIGLNAASNNTILDNIVSASEYAIFLETSCSNNDILSNDISSNDYGIYGYSSSSTSNVSFVLPNRISYNNFVDNGQSAFDDMGGNEWSENYWDSYTGVDANHDGVGDSPYLIPGSADASDNYPLMSPAEPPMVTTSAATAITKNSATLNGHLSSIGSASSVNVSFEWGLTTAYGNTTTVVAKTSAGAFSFELGSLWPNTMYHFRAKAVGHGTSYGLDNNFATQAEAGASATRTLPASVDPGANFNVTIAASGCGAFGQVVETLPSDFSYVSCPSTEVTVTVTDNTIKFTFIADSVTFTYTVKASTTEGVYTFSGILKDADMNEYPIGGDNNITVKASNVWDYDADGDGEISKTEALSAVVDYFAGVITKDQALEVIALYFA